MDGDTCVLTEKGPPGGGGPPGEGGGGPPGGGDGPPGGNGGGGAPGGRKKRQVDLPTINIDTFDVDWISFFAVQDKPVIVIFHLLQTKNKQPSPFSAIGLYNDGRAIQGVQRKHAHSKDRHRSWSVQHHLPGG